MNEASLKPKTVALRTFLRSRSSFKSLLASSKRSDKSSSLSWTLCKKACCSAMNVFIRLLTSWTTFLVDSLTAVQVDKQSRSHVSISVISVLDALWMFSIAVLRALSTSSRKVSQRTRIVNSDQLHILVNLAVVRPICSSFDLIVDIELENM